MALLTTEDVLNKKFQYVKFLAYRGFGADTIQTALKTAWNEDEDFYQ